MLAAAFAVRAAPGSSTMVSARVPRASASRTRSTLADRRTAEDIQETRRLYNRAMEMLAWLWDLVVRLDVHLADFVQKHGVWSTGCSSSSCSAKRGSSSPRSSRAIRCSSLRARSRGQSDMDIAALMATLVAAALCGDNVNYWVGRWIGPKVFHYERSRWFNPAHLQRAHSFYERHGGRPSSLRASCRSCAPCRSSPA